MKKSKTYRELQFENEYVSVWKTVIAPGQALVEDECGVDRVIVSLNGGNLKNILKENSSRELQSEPRQAYWVSGEETPTLVHQVNPGSEPLEMMIIEMKRPKDTPLPSQPIE